MSKAFITSDLFKYELYKDDNLTRADYTSKQFESLFDFCEDVAWEISISLSGGEHVYLYENDVLVAKICVPFFGEDLSVNFETFYSEFKKEQWKNCFVATELNDIFTLSFN